MAKKRGNNQTKLDSLSVTNVKLALDCPRIFYLNKFYGKKPFPYTGVVLGSIIHDIIDKIVKKLKEDTRIAPFLTETRTIDLEKFDQALKDFSYALFYEKFKEFPTKYQNLADMEKNIALGWELIQRVLEEVSRLLRKAFTQYPSEEAFSKVFLANERSFKLKIPEIDINFTLTGRFDSLWMDVSDGMVYLIDFKTGPIENIATDYSQIALYAYAVHQELQFKPRFSLFYLTAEKIEERKGSWEDLEALLPNIFNKIKEMRQWILDKENCPKTSMTTMCKHCHLFSFCKRYFPHDPPTADGEADNQNPIRSPLDKASIPKPLSSPDVEIKSVLKQKVSPGTETTPDISCEPELLQIGQLKDRPEEPALLDVKHLNRHVAILGSPGSGKTVLAKVIVEELLLQGYSCILIDPQGDLCSLLLPNDDLGKLLLENINFKIFTPGTKKGIPLALDLFEVPAKELLADEEYLNMQLDHISTNLLNTLGIDMKRAIPLEKALLESIIRTSWSENTRLNFQSLVEKITTIEEITSISTGQKIPVAQLIPTRDRTRLTQKLTSISAGTEGILFAQGQSLDISEMLESGPSCYIINLQGLGTDANKRQLVLSWIIQQVYNWMLTHPQAEQDALRLFFYIDEVADFIPIHPNNPPSKKLLSMLIRQARKYGVGVMMATQSPGSIEYKILDNINTLFVGKIPTKQSAIKIYDLIAPYLDQNPLKLENAMRAIRTSNPGEFFVIHPGTLSNVSIKVRQLHTKHETIAPDRISTLQPQNT